MEKKLVVEKKNPESVCSSDSTTSSSENCRIVCGGRAGHRWQLSSTPPPPPFRKMFRFQFSFLLSILSSSCYSILYYPFRSKTLTWRQKTTCSLYLFSFLPPSVICRPFLWKRKTSSFGAFWSPRRERNRPVGPPFSHGPSLRGVQNVWRLLLTMCAGFFFVSVSSFEKWQCVRFLSIIWQILALLVGSIMLL